MPASNATFVGEIDGVRVRLQADRAGSARCGTSPTARSRRARSRRTPSPRRSGWDVVPLTILRDGPARARHGAAVAGARPGRRTRSTWCPAGGCPTGYRHVFDGLDESRPAVSLVHEDTDALRRMAVFDVVVNNADRKGGHVLAMPDGHRYGVDHGVTFHVEHKLRTVLWGWAGEPLTEEEIAGVETVLDALRGDLGERLEDLLAVSEVEATRRRCRAAAARRRAARSRRALAGHPVAALLSAAPPDRLPGMRAWPSPDVPALPVARARRAGARHRHRASSSRPGPRARPGSTSAASRRTTPPTWATPRRTSPSTCSTAPGAAPATR